MALRARPGKWTVIGCYFHGQPAVVGVVAGHIEVESDSGYGVNGAFADHVEADSAYEAEMQVYSRRGTSDDS